jgi:hypothetical protein
MAFILALIAWKDLHSSVRLKILLSALLLAFCFTTSPFVFLAFLIAAGLFGLFHSRSVVETLRRNPKPILLYTGIAALLFLLASWSTITGISGRSSSLALNDLRVPIVGFLLGENPKSAIIDHLLTILGFPLVAFWIGLIEFGLPFILFLAWIIKKVSSGRRLFADGFDFVTIVFPPLYLLLTFVLRDSGGGGNFSMRGMIPAQILINFGALKVLEAPRSGLPQPAWKRWGLVYLFACFLVAQGVSAYAEVRGDSLNTIKQVEQTGIGKTTQKKTPLGYIAWLNANTPRDALILEDGCPPAGNTGSYRRLERSRFISPVCSETISQFNRDADFIVNDEWRRLSQNAETAVDILDLYQASSFWLKGKGPLFLVSWGNNPKWARLGEAMYRDAYVSIYQVPATPGK